MTTAREVTVGLAALVGVAVSETWRVGVLFSQTGVTAAVEQSQLNGTLLAIDEINAAGGVLGRPIQPIAYDPQSIPRNYGRLAERLLSVDRVRLIFGCYMSSTRKLAIPVVEAMRGLLFYPTPYEGFEYSPNCIYTGAAPNQNLLQLTRYLLEVYGNRFLMIGSNYIFPYESNRIVTDLVSQSHGRVLDEIYVPLDAEDEDFVKPMQQIRKLRPDVIFSTVVGQGTARLYRAHREAGFDPAVIPVASLTTSEAEVAEMETGVGEGHITAAPFFQTLTTPAATAFVADFKRRFGADTPVTACAEASYFQVHLAARALARAGSDDPELLKAQLYLTEFDAPQGRVRIDQETNHAYLWPRVARLDAAGRFQVVWDPGVRVRADPYCVAHSLDDWSAAAVHPVR